jgi:hypothetical protein
VFIRNEPSSTINIIELIIPGKSAKTTQAFLDILPSSLVFRYCKLNKPYERKTKGGPRAILGANDPYVHTVSRIYDQGFTVQSGELHK